MIFSIKIIKKLISSKLLLRFMKFLLEKYCRLVDFFV